MSTGACTAGEPPAKLTTQTGSAQNHGTTSCSADSESDRNDPSIEIERRICGTGETTSGRPQDGWADAGGANGPNGSECDRYVLSLVGVGPAGHRCPRHLELTVDDF